MNHCVNCNEETERLVFCEPCSRYTAGLNCARSDSERLGVAKATKLLQGVLRVSNVNGRWLGGYLDGLREMGSLERIDAAVATLKEAM